MVLGRWYVLPTVHSNIDPLQRNNCRKTLHEAKVDNASEAFRMITVGSHSALVLGHDFVQ